MNEFIRKKMFSVLYAYYIYVYITLNIYELQTFSTILFLDLYVISQWRLLNVLKVAVVMVFNWEFAIVTSFLRTPS